MLPLPEVTNNRFPMKIEALLDYETVLANRGCPVHLALRFTAPPVASDRTRPIAFCLVIDRSGSMEGVPLEAAKEAARLVVRNLRKSDYFSLAVFDDTAQVVAPLQCVENRQALLVAIDAIRPGGSTNLTGGWMLGRDELQKAPADLPRRLLLLTDGQLNVGIVEPEAVRQVVAAGLERHHISTSCLGFGDGYNEDLLALLANASNAHYYDANSPEQLPAIFEAELEGLQALAVQNLRVRLKRLDFCDSLAVLADYPCVHWAGGSLEITVGSLVSEEERTLLVAMEIPPIPLVGGGKPAADLEGERLVEVEVLYDRLQPDQVISHRWRQVVRVLPVQDETQVRTNSEMIAIVSAQHAGKTLGAAIAEADSGRVKEAKERLLQAIAKLKAYPAAPETADGLRVLEEFLDRLQIMGTWSARERKSARYQSEYFRKMSSAQLWSSNEPPPSFARKQRKRPEPRPGDSRQEEDQP
jgi:Ca-activated chloride channel homolog